MKPLKELFFHILWFILLFTSLGTTWYFTWLFMMTFFIDPEEWYKWNTIRGYPSWSCTLAVVIPFLLGWIPAFGVVYLRAYLNGNIGVSEEKD